MSGAGPYRFDVAHIRVLADADIEAMATLAWGPLRRSGRGFRAKKSSALSIYPGKDGRPRWKDYRSNEGGNSLDFYAVFVLGLSEAKDDFPRVLESLAGEHGICPGAGPTAAERDRVQKRLEDDRQKEQRLSRAKKEADKAALNAIINAARDIKGSPAEQYLRSRGVTSMPDNRKAAYLPGDTISGASLAGMYAAAEAKAPFALDQPALIAYARNTSGLITGLQRVLIRPDGSGKADAAIGKPSTGTLSGAYAKFSGDGSGSLLIAEGIETALSIWQATGRETWAKMSGLSSVQPDGLPHDRAVTICRDADLPGSPADKGLRARASDLVAAGFSVSIATPPDAPEAKWDFNDTLQRDGIGAIREAISAAVDFIPDADPPKGTRSKAFHPEFGVSHLDGPRLHQEAVAAWGEKAIAHAWGEDGPAPRMLLSGAQGVGKTRKVLEVATDAYGLITLLHVPTVEKIEEAVADLGRMQTQKSPRIMPMFGRSAKPNGSAETMCKIPDAAQKVSVAGGNPRRSLCPNCPFHDGCAYLLQEHNAKHLQDDPRGVVFVASHGYLGAKIPGDVSPDLAIVDEAPAGLIPSNETQIQVADLGNGLQVNKRKVEAFADAKHDLIMKIRPFAVAIGRAYYDAPGRELAELRERGFDLDAARDALDALGQFTDANVNAKAEAAAKEARFAGADGSNVDFAAHIEKAIEGCVSPAAKRHKHLFEAVIDGLERGADSTPAIWPNHIKGKADDGQEVLKPALAVATLQRALISKNAPLLHLDGTADPDLAAAVLGSMERAHIPVERNARVIQIPSGAKGRKFSNQSIRGVGADGVALYGRWQEDAQRLREDIAQIVAAQAKPFAFGNMGVMEAMAPQLPAGCQISHFGAVRAVNAFEECETAIAIGRQLPPVKAVEVQARAVAAALGRNFTPLPEGAAWPRQMRGIRMRDGSVTDTETEYHPDPTADMMLRQIREADLLQGLDRVRPIFNRRTLIILSDTALDITVDQCMTLKELVAGGTRKQRLLKAGVILGSKSETLRCYPEIWKDSRGLRRDNDACEALSEIGGQNPYIILCGFCPPNSEVALVEYQRARPEGSRGAPPAKIRALVVSPAEHVRAKLESRAGPLAQFEIIETRILNPMSDEDAEAEAIAFADGVPPDQRRQNKPHARVDTPAPPLPDVTPGEALIRSINFGP